jgi:hypothetical protein
MVPTVPGNQDEAMITKIIIDSVQSPAFGGASFGEAGRYEKLVGRAFGELDPESPLNAVIADAQQAQPAPGGARVLYALQGASDPPTFTLFVNRELPSTYLRYLERKLRERFDLGAVPIKLRVRKRTS